MTPDPLTATALGADGRPWDVEHGRTVVCCPSCGLGIDAIHDEGDGTYRCPCCDRERR